MMSKNPNDILVWAQVGGQMTQIAVTAIGNIKSMIAASGQDKAAQDAALARTHALYDTAIAHEEQVGKTE
jgi:hypothetical protein